MDNFLDDFFSGNSAPEAEAEIPEVESIEDVSNAAPEAVEATPEVETEVEAPIEPTPTQEARMVPLSAVQEERRLKKEAIDQVNALRQQLADQQAKQAAVPDPYDDPTGFIAHQHQLVEQQVHQAVTHQRFMDSRERALAQHGQEYINQVADWAGGVAATDPTFESRMLAQADPANWVIENYKRSELLKSFEADPDAFVRQRAIEMGYANAAPAVEAPQPPANKPLGPKSLANAKSRGGASTQTTVIEDAFELFNKP